MNLPSTRRSLNSRYLGICLAVLSAGLPLLPVFAWADPTTTAPTTAAPSEKEAGPAESPMIESVDIPTAEILNAGTYAATFRFYNEGGMMSRLIIAPLKLVNLGLSLDAQDLIGSGDPHVITPGVYFKLRFFDGTDMLPALAFGYDSQGYLYQQDTRNFLHPEKGLYLVGSHEILLPDLELHAGVNRNFNTGEHLFGFLGATYKVVPAFALLFDYDNIRDVANNRFNMGGRYYVTSYFNVDFAARNIGRGTDKGGERILRLNYVGNFPSF